MLKELAKPPVQLEFQFFMRNVATGRQYHDAIRDRKPLPVTTAERARHGTSCGLWKSHAGLTIRVMLSG
jgi:hypothetical protein